MLFIGKLAYNIRPDVMSLAFGPTTHGMDASNNESPPPLLDGGEFITSHDSSLSGTYATASHPSDPSHSMWSNANPGSPIQCLGALQLPP
jgi:hypothetical protein